MNNQYSNNYQYNPVQEQQEYAETERLREIVREELEYNRPKKIWVKIIALLLVGALLGTGGTFAALHLNKSAQKPVATVTPETTADKMQIDINLNEDITIENAVATKAIPSIVGITAKVRGQQENYFFYNNEEYMTAQGSGVIVDSSGYILTNSHVVNNGDSEDLLVSFSDNSETKAKLVWHDRTLDLAIVKVEKDNLVVAELGDSDQIQVGDKAIAVGNPLGLALQSTLTSGYISGMDRTINLQDGNIMDGLLQTDAAINSGNSGGALLNAEGKVIGINTARPRVADGIGFAIPINTAKPIVDKVINEGSFEPLYLGISGLNVQMVSRVDGKELPTDTGVLIKEVYPNSPADLAGLASGDIITSINDISVDSMNSLKGQLLKYELEDTITISYYRNNQEKTTEVTFSSFEFPQEIG